jgi:hypothetical protein
MRNLTHLMRNLNHIHLMLLGIEKADEFVSRGDDPLCVDMAPAPSVLALDWTTES